MRQALLLLALFSPSLMSAALEYHWTSPVFLAEGHTFLVSRENGGGGLVVTFYVPFSELADTIRYRKRLLRMHLNRSSPCIEML